MTKSKTRKKAEEAYVAKLSKIGQDIIDTEMRSVSYKNQTFNLHDSYGWCVYVDGKIVAEKYMDKTASEPRKMKGKDVWGSEEIKKLFHGGYTPTSSIELAVGVAMPYGGYLHRRKYEVFALAAQSVKEAASRIKDARYKAVGWIN